MIPELSFTIPSVHDNTPLDCRIYHPTHRSPTTPSLEKSCFSRGAIIAHPYTSLGGSYDDCVVLLAVTEVLKLGFVVGTFNFRGAGSSKGRASWTAKAELADYISFVGFLIHYLNGLRLPASLDPSMLLSDNLTTSSPTSSTYTTPQQPSMADPPRMTLLLGGYSYGSLITCHLPNIEDILNRFSYITKGAAEDEIRLRALSLSTQRNKERYMQSEVMRGRSFRGHEKLEASSHSIAIAVGGEETKPGSRRSSRESRSLDIVRKSVERSKRTLGLRKSSSRLGSEPALDNECHINITIHVPSLCFLLVSPLLPPISWLATMFSKLSIHGLLPNWSVLAGGNHQSSHQPEENLTRYPTMAIYGSNDFFTSHKKLRKWAEALAGRPESAFQFREITGAGHFWQERGVEEELRGSIREWLQGILASIDNMNSADSPISKTST